MYTDLSDDGPGNSAVTFRDLFRAHLRLDLESIGCQSCTAVFQLLVGLWTDKEDLLSFACDTVGDKPLSMYENDTIFPMDASNEDMNVAM